MISEAIWMSENNDIYVMPSTDEENRYWLMQRYRKGDGHFFVGNFATSDKAIKAGKARN